MASCGPSNPLQSAKDHLQRDTTLQREHVATGQPWAPAQGFRSSPAPRQPGETASAQFESFNRFAPPGVGADAARLRAADAPQARGAMPYLSERDPLAHGVGQQWAAEFQQAPAQQHAHAHAQQHAQQQQAPHQAPAAYMSVPAPHVGAQWPGVPAYAPLATGVVPSVRVDTTQPQRAAPAPPSDAVFEEVFDAFEKKLAAEQQAQAQAPAPAQADEKTPDAAPQDSEDLSRVATQIMNTLGAADTERSAQLAEKMQSSKFMALMDKLKSSQVKASSTDFVEAGGAKVDPHALEAAPINVASSQRASGPTHVQVEQRVDTDARANADWPPQRRDASTAPFGRSWRDAQYLVGLEDPDTYFKKLKASLQASNELIAGMPSPFEAARDLGPKTVRVGDWEERYESW